MKYRNKLFLGTAALLAIAFGLSSCAAVHTSVKKRNLDVQTKASETIFLEPVAPDKKIIFVSIRNTSDKNIDVKTTIVEALKNNGYVITLDPTPATYMLQANVLQVGKGDLRDAHSALEAGFSGAVLGAAVGSTSSSSRGTVAGGLLGAIVGTVADAMVDDTVYTMITDLQIRERPLSGEIVKQVQQSDNSQGSSSTVSQTSETTSNWKTYRTRIVSTANKVNLKFEEALPELKNGLIRSVSGMFIE